MAGWRLSYAAGCALSLCIGLGLIAGIGLGLKLAYWVAANHLNTRLQRCGRDEDRTCASDSGRSYPSLTNNYSSPPVTRQSLKSRQNLKSL